MLITLHWRSVPRRYSAIQPDPEGAPTDGGMVYGAASAFGRHASNASRSSNATTTATTTTHEAIDSANALYDAPPAPAGAGHAVIPGGGLESFYADVDGAVGFDDNEDISVVRMDLADGQGWFHTEVGSRGAAEAILGREAVNQPDVMLYLVRPRADSVGSYAVSTVLKGKYSHQLLVQAIQGSPFTINGTLLQNAGTTLAQVVPNVVRQLASKSKTAAAPVNAAGSDC